MGQWGDQGQDRTPCILPWSISEPMLYGVLSRGYVPIRGNQFWSLKWACWWFASGCVCFGPAREVSQQYLPWEALSSVSRVGVFCGTSANEKYALVSSIKVSAGSHLTCGCDNSYLNAASEVFVGDTQHPLSAGCCCLARCYSACGSRVTNTLLVVASLLFL